jgi:beta-lactamase superfamily II metal-dependent hydrolase
MANTIDYVSTETAKVTHPTSGEVVRQLLWGDRVIVVNKTRDTARIRARGMKSEGLIALSALGGKPLLECYFIDVGQGDGVLIRTPDLRHILIDGGFPRSKQVTRKNAADFVDWKFFKDYEQDTIVLDALIASHNDEDHYGGLSDLLSDRDQDVEDLEAKHIAIEAAYHAGLSWWETPTQNRTLGTEAKRAGKSFYTQLVSDRASVQSATNAPASSARLQGAWGTFLKRVLAARTRAGTPTPIMRLSQSTGYLPGFAPARGKASIKVLGPIEHTVNGGPALRKFPNGDSKNTNGHSVLLRVDYGKARILLTGDLNKAAQTAMLADSPGLAAELACDVAKGCHHGSDDVSYAFLSAMQPAVTVISSGDNETHDHPRASILGASATTGHLKIVKDELVSPLVYCTEIARSYKLGRAASLSTLVDGAAVKVRGEEFKQSKLHFDAAATDAGTRLPSTYIVTDLVYGLVNVRTDGKKILCATRSERDQSWDVKVVQSRF